MRLYPYKSKVHVNNSLDTITESFGQDDLFLYAGYEVQKGSSKWKYFYGGDLMFNYNYSFKESSCCGSSIIDDSANVESTVNRVC